MTDAPIFDHESLQDRKSIKRYLKAITDGMSKGSLSLSNGTADTKLEPDGLIRLRVEVNRPSGRCELTIKMDWHDKDAVSIANDPLVISSEP
jgi:amphi-Trp domain-containing protein